MCVCCECHFCTTENWTKWNGIYEVFALDIAFVWRVCGHLNCVIKRYIFQKLSPFANLYEPYFNFLFENASANKYKVDGVRVWVSSSELSHAHRSATRWLYGRGSAPFSIPFFTYSLNKVAKKKTFCFLYTKSIINHWFESLSWLAYSFSSQGINWCFVVPWFFAAQSAFCHSSIRKIEKLNASNECVVWFICF